MHRKFTLTRRAAVLATTILWLTAASQALALDTLTPPLVDRTLPAGGSTTVAKTLQMDGLPAEADIIVAIDTTGSMSAALTNAKADAAQICLDVQAAIPGARFAAVEFQDYPIDPYGVASDDPYELHTTYTADCTAFSFAVAAMALGNGLDLPESNNRVHYEAYADPALLAVRNPDASRFLVVLADDRPHSVVPFGACGDTGSLSDPGRNEVNESGAEDDIDTLEALDGLLNDGTTLLYISYNSGTSANSCHEDMAAHTGGDAVPDDQAQDIGAFIISEAEETPYTVGLEISAGCQLGITFSPAPPYGPFTGDQTISFSETIVAPTVPGVYSCTVTAVRDPGGPTTAVEQIIVRVVPADPFTLVLTPETDTNTVDDQHCVLATVRDAFGNPTPGITVRFGVTGSVTTGGAVPTNAAGEATFCYTGPGLPGADTITAYADTNNNSVNDAAPADPEDTARKAWLIPANNEDCKVTNGGWIITTAGNRANFGGNAKGAGPKGNENYLDHGLLLHVKSTQILAVTCSADGTSASIFGTAKIAGLSGELDFRIDVRDLGEPGRTDRYRLRLSNGYDSGDQQLSGGNIQIH